MNYSKSIFLIVIVIMLCLVTACGGSELVEAKEPSIETNDAHVENENHADDEEGQMTHGHVEAPDEFSSLTNPYGDDHEAIEAGEETYDTLCATCHGLEGKGDGLAAENLDPKPADLSDGMMMSELSDGYLFWRVSKGGALEPFNSTMPPWETGLTEDQRWQVISFVRSLSNSEERHIEETLDEDTHEEGSGHSD